MDDLKSDYPEGEQTESGIYKYSEFALQLKKIRIYRGYRHQAKAAEDLEFSRQVFSLWELGKRLPTLKQITRIANFFRVRIEYFFLPQTNPNDYDLDKQSLEL